MADDSQEHAATPLDLFREKIARARRQTGHLQRELADALGIDAQVLSRKLHGAKQAFPTHAEVKLIIKTLASWDAITTQVEAIELLSLMGLKAESFSEQEWKTSPLNRLEPVVHIDVTNTLALPTISRANIPLPAPPTTLIGREHHVQMLLDRLRQDAVRLLTLRGAGGVGKTRLALEVAQQARQILFPDGVFLVSLATIRDATLVASTIVQTLHHAEPLTDGDPEAQGVPSHEEVLKEFLREKNVLLVLDNVEQIPDISPFISNLLNTIATLKIMVTSRTVLHLYGEHEFDVPPLEVWTPNVSFNTDEISQCPATRLFVERAQAVDPTFRFTKQNATTIAQICTRLDGLPLAIELAAARTKVLPLSMILQRLTGGKTGQSLSFLRTTAHNTLQRHQTLYDTLDWSYELLAPSQQRLFRHLSVFLGSWSLDAALALSMAGDEAVTQDDVLEQIESLINHSLVKRMSQEEGLQEEILGPRFYCLETIREYGLHQLEMCGEHEEIQRQHATYYLNIAEGVALYLTGREQAAAVSLLVLEQDNLRAAFAWSIEHQEDEIAQRLCGALGKFWEARTQFQEAQRWIDTALKTTRETPPVVRARLLMTASRLALWGTACERSRELAQEALQLYETTGDISGKASAIFQIGDTWHMQGEYTMAISYLEESAQLLQEQKNWSVYGFALSRLGAVATLQGNFSQAWTWLNKALPILREYSEPGLLNVTIVYLGVLAFVQGDLPQGIMYLREGLMFALQINNRYMLATALLASGCLLGVIREPRYTARVCSAAEALFESLNTALPAGYRPLYDVYLTSIKSQIDTGTWDTWWAEGKTLSQQEITTLVLTELEANTWTLPA
jgi:predicted ATPase/transcriptional regulator with XRE-family HTH domain